MGRFERYLDPRAPRMWTKWKDAKLEQLVDKAKAALDYDEYQDAIKEAVDHITVQHYRIIFPLMANVVLWHPYVNNFNGEWYTAICDTGPIYARVWIDQDLKKEMGY